MSDTPDPDDEPRPFGLSRDDVYLLFELANNATVTKGRFALAYFIDKLDLHGYRIVRKSNDNV